MITVLPEIGLFALILAACIACVQCALPLVGAAIRQPAFMAIARPAAMVQFLLLGAAYAALTASFVLDDFSLRYVAMTSNTLTPLIYKITGVWGGHEGSILLWALVLSGWSAAVAIIGKRLPLILQARVLGVLGFISVWFLLFILLTSNPFDRLIPAAINGSDLNPLLQDPGMAAHPPLLYMGYVGFSVTFAFAIAALLGGALDSATVRWMRPWANVAWLFLTLGIALGSYWAYYELGWGGWWFWDPVENASLMPWLVGTALIHCMAATEKRGVFKAWTVLLALLTFSLSLLGTFLVRSGVLTSVHSFASDPERGLFILVFLVAVVGGSMLLYSFRAQRLTSKATFSLFSREAALLLNNIFLTTICATVLLGTMYPLFIDALGLGKLSVGAPYFTTMFIPLVIPLLLFVGVGSLLRWRKDDVHRWTSILVFAAVCSVLLGVIFIMSFSKFSYTAWLGLALAFWVIATTVGGFWQRIRYQKNKLFAITHTPLAFWGMTIAHLGIAVMAVGITLTSVYASQQEVLISPGESYQLSDDVTFTFNGISARKEQNYSATVASITVHETGRPTFAMNPEKRFYPVRGDVMTEAAIDGGMRRDLFVALGDQVPDRDAWTFRLQRKPFISWIWMGAVFMAFGGLLGAADKRYRVTAKKSVKSTIPSSLQSSN